MTPHARLPLAPSPPVQLADLDRLNEEELLIFAHVVEVFYQRTGRDPIGVEYPFILITVRLMTMEGVWWLQ